MPNLNIYLAEKPYVDLVKSAAAMGKSGSIVASEILCMVLVSKKLRQEFGLPPV